METTATQKFIEDALSGGWKWIDLPRYENAKAVLSDHDFYIEKMVLTPFAWQVVAKTRGWKDSCFACGYDHKHGAHPDGWKYYWHRFIDHLADGKSVEEALSAIT